MLSKRRIKHRGDPVRVPRGPRRGKASGAACLRPRDCPCPLYLYLYIPDLDPIYPIPPINPPPAPFIYRRPPDTTQRPGRHAFYILSRYGGENRLQLRTKDSIALIFCAILSLSAGSCSLASILTAPCTVALRPSNAWVV